MRIAVISASNTEKEKLIQGMLNKWNNFKRADCFKYGILKEPNKLVQQAIIDTTIDEMINRGSSTDDVIIDTCSLDHLVDVMYFASHGIGDFDDNFISDIIKQVRLSLGFLDLILFVPVDIKKTVDIKEDENQIVAEMAKVTDNVQSELNNFYAALHTAYLANSNEIYPFNEPDGSPAMIEIFGNDIERIAMLGLYLNDNGRPYSSEPKDSILQLPDFSEQSDINSLMDQIQLKKK